MKRGAKSVISTTPPCGVEEARRRARRCCADVLLLGAHEVERGRRRRCRARRPAAASSSSAQNTGSPSKRGKQPQTIVADRVDERADACRCRSARDRAMRVIGPPRAMAVPSRSARAALEPVARTARDVAQAHGGDVGPRADLDGDAAAARCTTAKPYSSVTSSPTNTGMRPAKRRLAP